MTQIQIFSCNIFEYYYYLRWIVIELKNKIEDGFIELKDEMEKVQKQAMAILSIIGSIISFYKAIPYQKNVTFN